MGTPPGPPVMSTPPPPGPNYSGFPVLDPARNLSAVKIARVAALVSFLGLIAAIVAPIAVILVTGIEVHYGRFHVGSGAFTAAGFKELVYVFLFAGIVALVSVVLHIVAFNALRKLRPGFAAPMALTIVGLLGLLLVVVGIAWLLQDFLQASTACSAPGATSSCFDISQTVGAVFSIFGGLLLAFIGWIGMILGVYRIGKTYGSTLTKVGAILYIIPFVSLIAPILVLVGIQGIVRSLQPGGGPPV
jgi:hypothetical protein